MQEFQMEMIQPRQVGLTRRKQLLEFCTRAHAGQKRKYTGDAYILHPMKVAIEAMSLHRLAWEIGLCHDLKEDTKVTYFELSDKLIEFGYSFKEATFIRNVVYELTDLYTHDMFPQINRAKRKRLEAQRLAETSWLAQSIKCIDLNDNTKSIVKNDKSFAKVYLPEKEYLLSLMNKGHELLYKLSLSMLEASKKELNEEIERSTSLSLESGN